MPTDPRRQMLDAWLTHHLPDTAPLEPASGDASFRRYFRALTRSGASYIVMDAPPAQEPLAPFLDITQRLAQADVHVPNVHAHDTHAGFALLDDLGTTPYLAALSPTTADALYADAFATLLRIQRADCTGLPDYDAAMLGREMALFPDWFLGRHLGLTPDTAQRALLDTVNAALIASALAQPQVFVHRDYHSRNLMRTATDNPGVLDYQDAVRGPLTYDLVSLLRDAYVAWPEERIRAWALSYRDQAARAGICLAVDDATFLRWFDLMGLQRQLKVLGIFARLYHRDGKAGYLADLPRVLDALLRIAPRYPDTAPLAELLHTLDIPARLAKAAPPCAP
ncbi:aminoglycoside phosphotransferase family protein [Acidihalobacter ferrooxydans]|uniref:Aminoglycoside phosphotransferase domain-containing protein n=1 Tax=Acidihalobacter ferrooxydans TaxID=1765967 RepID=A0A1P8UDE3_9GAMM|nr:phosphotransferase [Acidihalobacter ferrooxydans]APZ41877.1 hypothetical protein BW247_01160 [Acidihalobacter ferrooxydans]